MNSHDLLNRLTTLDTKAQLVGSVPIETLTTDLNEAAALGFLAAVHYVSQSTIKAMEKPPDPAEAFIQVFVRRK